MRPRDLVRASWPTALAARVRGSLQRIAAEHPGRRVAVVTHGGVIAQTLALAADAPPFAFLSGRNASLSQVVLAGERWTVRRFNDTAHLPDDLSRVGAPDLRRTPARTARGLAPRARERCGERGPPQRLSSWESSASSWPPAISAVSSSRLTSERFLSSTRLPSLRMMKWSPTR